MGDAGPRLFRSRIADPTARRSFRAAALAIAVLPGLGGADPRVGGDPRVAPWSAVGRLQIPGVSRCSAVVIDPHWVATAAHCLTSRALIHVPPVSAMHLLLGYADGGFVRHVQPDAVVLAAGAEPLGAPSRGSDLALLHFSEALPDALPVAGGRVAPGESLIAGGYGQDRAERIAVDPACRAAGYVRGRDGLPLLRHDCNATRGTSGGPVLMRGANGGWTLAGIQVGAVASGAGGVAVPGAAVAALLASVR